jgi:two-component system, NtrC family, sensor kinase
LLEQALANLLLNACDASPRGAKVHVSVRRDAEALAFVVEDEGEGIHADSAARALEPFFTTKAGGRGTGLGLAIVQEITASHGGTLELAQRTPARGTRATIRLAQG